MLRATKAEQRIRRALALFNCVPLGPYSFIRFCQSVFIHSSHKLFLNAWFTLERIAWAFRQIVCYKYLMKLEMSDSLGTRGRSRFTKWPLHRPVINEVAQFVHMEISYFYKSFFLHHLHTLFLCAQIYPLFAPLLQSESWHIQLGNYTLRNVLPTYADQGAACGCSDGITPGTSDIPTRLAVERVRQSDTTHSIDAETRS